MSEQVPFLSCTSEILAELSLLESDVSLVTKISFSGAKNIFEELNSVISSPQTVQQNSGHRIPFCNFRAGERFVQRSVLDETK